MRFEPFLLEDNEVPKLPIHKGDGLYSIHYDLPEIEQSENRNQVKTIECIFNTLCELFELDNVEMQNNCFSYSFFIVEEYKTKFNIRNGVLSPELSRKKLKQATTMELSGAMIDLLLTRNKWNKKITYKTYYV